MGFQKQQTDSLNVLRWHRARQLKTLLEFWGIVSDNNCFGLVIKNMTKDIFQEICQMLM